MRRGAELLRVLIPARERLVRDSYAMAGSPALLIARALVKALSRASPPKNCSSWNERCGL